MKLKVYVDESGIISKHNISGNNYFIIAFVITNNPDKVNRIFIKERRKLVKKSTTLIEKFKINHEIKASDISENKKTPIYKKIIDKCEDCLELGFIILDNNNITPQFKSVSARTFNYLVEAFLSKWFLKYSKFSPQNQTANGDSDIIVELSFVIDERNIATKASLTLEEYLNLQLQMDNPVFNSDIKVKYSDSKNYNLLQLADFSANTCYRKYQKNNKFADYNMKLLKKITCGNDNFYFPYKSFIDKTTAKHLQTV